MIVRRILCLTIPNLPLLAVLRIHPELRGLPLIVGGAPSEPAPVLACSGAAARAGVRRGMRLKEAQSRCPGAVFVPAMPTETKALIQFLGAQIEQVSPIVEAETDGTFLMALEGLQRLWPDEQMLAAHMRALMRKHRIQGVRIGIADTKYAAFIAAQTRRLCIVPPGTDADFLQAQSIQHLPAPPEMVAALSALGIHSLGDFAALPPHATAMRFGSAAPRLLRLAGGTDDRRVLPAPSTPRLHVCLSFEDSVSDRERLLQAIDRPLTDLYRQMDLLGLAAHALHLRLRLEDGSTYDAILPLFEPLASLHQLRRLVHWHMEPLELAGVVAEIEVELTSLYRLQGRQLELFAPRDGRDARDLLGEVTARWGPDTLRQGVLKTSRRLETGFVWITPKPPENKSMAYDRKTLPSQVTLRPHPVIRLLAEPREVLVHLEEGQPAAITVRQTPERIVAIGGPWRLVEGWWDTPLDRDEYQVSTASGVYYVVHDRQAGTWLLLGAFD